METSSRAHRRGRATIEEVAAAAGVSIATVSRALRGLPNVATSTRERVRAIAEELDYRADPAASRLATGRSNAIGLAVPILSSWYFANVVAGAEAVATEAGYDTIVIGVGTRDARHRLAYDLDRMHRRIDGVILVDIAMTDADLAVLADHQFPVVSIGPQSRHFPSIGIDDLEVGRIATNHLLALGHTRIGLVHGQPSDPLDFVVPQLRRQGFEDAMTAAGLVPDPRYAEIGNFSIEGGYEAAMTLLQREPRPTALFALSDEMAFGALRAARDLGLAVPEDVSIVGVDDHDVAGVLNLTTVRQDVTDHGALAARLLLERLDETPRPIAHIMQPTRLITRGTTASPSQ